MTDFLDANPIVRYVVIDYADQARAAAELIESDTELTVTPTVLLEAGFTLRSVYRLSREDVVDALLAVIRRDNVAVHGLDKTIAETALEMCRPSGRVSLGDAMLWAAAVSEAPARVHTFDTHFPSEGVEVREPK